MSEHGTRAREQWLLAGQELLRRHGIAGVKLQALTAELGLTTGSFYHHFGGMPGYLRELAELYSHQQPADQLDAIAHLPPRERLAALGDVAQQHRLAELDAAMRDWAVSSELAAAAVEALDRRLLTFMAQAFRDLGHGTREAQVRSQLLLAIGIARMTTPWKIRSTDAELVLSILAP